MLKYEWLEDRDIRNNGEETLYVSYIVHGTGFLIDEVAPGGTWHEGAGEEYHDISASKEEADKSINEYMKSLK